MTRIAVRAFAKINLSLRVKGTRADGFHELQTILQAIDLCDRVMCERRRGPFAIRCATSGVPTDGTNLVWKAAQRLWSAAGRRGEPRGALVTLDKHIPMEAGLGGGSSDAAAALVALRRLWALKVPDSELRAIAATLGSDVPFFLVGGTAIGLGRGEEVYPLEDLPRYWVVLARPPFGVATKDAYAWLDDHRRMGDMLPKEVLPASLPGTWLGSGFPLVNDLEAPVVQRHPEIGALESRLRRLGASMAAMSGSGSTVFGVFPTGTSARAAALQLRGSGADIWRARFQGRKSR